MGYLLEIVVVPSPGTFLCNDSCVTLFQSRQSPLGVLGKLVVQHKGRIARQTFQSK